MAPSDSPVRELFSKAFGAQPRVIGRAPGRVEVLGNHTDYNEGFVLSAAIDRYLHVAVAPSDDFRFVSALFPETVIAQDAAPQKDSRWVNYMLGVYAMLQQKRWPVRPFSMAVQSDIPMGAGLSSSAALEVATGLALSRLYGFDVPAEEMARICQKAEHEYAGAKCGLLDQFSVLFGKKDHLLFTDFRTLEHELLPIAAEVTLAITPSGITHSLGESAYNDRRRECFEAAAWFSKGNPAMKTLRDVSWNELMAAEGAFGATAFRRARHIVGEDERVVRGKGLLRAGDLPGFGKLLYESHESSRKYFENSCSELDLLVDIVKTIDGVYGARLSGGGFGGATLTLLDSSACEPFADALCETFEKQCGRKTTVHIARIANGACAL